MFLLSENCSAHFGDDSSFISQENNRLLLDIPHAIQLLNGFRSAASLQMLKKCSGKWGSLRRITRGTVRPVHTEEPIGREVRTTEYEQLEGKSEDFGLETDAMNCVQRTGRKSFCDMSDAEDTESTFSKRLRAFPMRPMISWVDRLR
jgi:hypothetical protein